MAQRVVRAKRTLSDAGAALEEPSEAERAERLTAVLSVIYLLYNEGYSATAGTEWMRPTLCDEALRLGRILAALAPRESEVHGLSALMELQSSRLAARTAEDGSPILLLDQDRSRWDLCTSCAVSPPGTGGSEHDRARPVRPPGCDRGLPRPG